MHVLAPPEIMKYWSDLTHPSAVELRRALAASERFANDTPGRGAVNFDWWKASILAHKLESLFHSFLRAIAYFKLQNPHRVAEVEAYTRQKPRSLPTGVSLRSSPGHPSHNSN